MCLALPIRIPCIRQTSRPESAEKTRLIEFGHMTEINRRKRTLSRPETFDFLRFTHSCSRARRGAFTMLRLMIKKRMWATLTAIREVLYRRRHEPVTKVGRWLNRVVRGYFNYHAVPRFLPSPAGPAYSSGTIKTGCGSRSPGQERHCYFIFAVCTTIAPP